MKWIKADTVDKRPVGKKEGQKLVIKYADEPDVLIFNKGEWHWYLPDSYPVGEDYFDWKFIEWLDESIEENIVAPLLQSKKEGDDYGTEASNSDLAVVATHSVAASLPHNNIEQGLRPCDCKDSVDTSKLNEQGIGHNDESITVVPNSVILNLAQISVRMSMKRFKMFAEWYLSPQIPNTSSQTLTQIGQEQYSENDMKRCFEAAREEHLGLGLLYEDFDSYLKSIKAVSNSF